MVFKFKAVAEDKRNMGKNELWRTHVANTGHELGASFLQSERFTTELPKHVVIYAQYYNYKFIS